MATGSGRSTGARRHAHHAGFTLVELIVVVAIIGILVTVALPQYRDAVQRAREAVLREDLYILRDAIDQYFTDRGAYPESLGSLVDEEYIRAVPEDPITKSADTWITVEAEASESDPDAPSGIKDVKSGASGTSLSGIPFSDF